MRKEEALVLLDSIEHRLREFRTDIRKISSKYVNKAQLKKSAQQVCSRWFEQASPLLLSFGVPDDTRAKYETYFTSLLQLATRPSRKATYLKTIDDILPDFKNDLYLVVMKSVGQIVSVDHLTKILDTATEEESDYLKEALGCASQKFFRASVVLGWSAAVHRMHKVVERLGLDEFNKKSEEMKAKTEGRYKRFNKSFSVQSLNDLRALVFDTDLLWVLEYWQLIDPNQHERLEICFTMRNNSAHPGEAPITEENLSSFYSDLKTMVFDNPRFKLGKLVP